VSPPDAQPVKTGERVAARIVEDINAAGWPVGEVLGNEPELMGRYGVSRNAFREAVRLLEHLDAARMREGRGGGLVVTEPRAEPVTRAAAIVLRRQGVGVAELYEARATLEVDIVARAVERLDDNGAARIRNAVEAERTVTPDEIRGHTRSLHMTLAEVAGNRPLALFLDSLISLSDEYARSELEEHAPEFDDRLQRSHEAHGAIADAVLARDLETATRRMRVHLAAVLEWMPEPWIEQVASRSPSADR
jgi:DNA-binding FadR family transcriptional regulator